MDTTYIFIHIPKTAGTTLRYHYQKYLQDQKTFIHFANKGDKQAIKEGMVPFNQRPSAIRRQARVILGHNVNKFTKLLLKPNKICEVVLFRDPNEWTISRYNQYANALDLKSKSYLAFEKWLKHEAIQSQFDWFLCNYMNYKPEDIHWSNRYKNLMDALSHINIIGFVDQFDQIMQPINLELNVPTEMVRENVTGQNRKRDIFNEDGNNKNELQSINEYEYKLYNKIKNNLTDLK